MADGDEYPDYDAREDLARWPYEAWRGMGGPANWSGQVLLERAENSEGQPGVTIGRHQVPWKQILNFQLPDNNPVPLLLSTDIVQKGDGADTFQPPTMVDGANQWQLLAGQQDGGTPGPNWIGGPNNGLMSIEYGLGKGQQRLWCDIKAGTIALPPSNSVKIGVKRYNLSSTQTDLGPPLLVRCTLMPFTPGLPFQAPTYSLGVMSLDSSGTNPQFLDVPYRAAEFILQGGLGFEGFYSSVEVRGAAQGVLASSGPPVISPIWATNEDGYPLTVSCRITGATPVFAGATFILRP